MGVKLKKLLQPRKISLEELNNKKLAVDAYNTIYQFLTTIRQYDGTPLKDSEGRTTSHLLGLFYRNINLMSQGIKPVYVFDGEPPFFKKDELDLRKERKEKAKEDYTKALAEEDYETARLKASQTVYLTDELVEESKKLLDVMGIPVVQAPSEGEAQAAYMVIKGDCYAVSSQDYDSLLFGAPRSVRNLNIAGKKKLPGKNVYIEVVPELLELDKVLNELGIDKNRLIMLSMLVGTDYNNGVKGVGPVKALKLVKEEKDFDEIIKTLNWDERNLKLIYDFFRKPPVTDSYKVVFKDLNTERIKRILVDEHGFSESRVDSAVKKFFEDKSKKSQTSLFNY